MAEPAACTMGSCPLIFDPEALVCSICRHNKGPKMVIALEMEVTPFPRCAEACDTVVLLGVSECLSVCPSKFPNENPCVFDETIQFNKFDQTGCGAYRCTDEQIDSCFTYAIRTKAIPEMHKREGGI